MAETDVIVIGAGVIGLSAAIAAQARRLLALAAIRDGMNRTEAARIGGARAIGVASGRSSAGELRDAGADVALDDLADTAAVVDAVDIPVIASGGVGRLQDLVDGAVDGGADAVLAASIFHDAVQELRELKCFLHSKGVPVRLQ